MKMDCSWVKIQYEHELLMNENMYENGLYMDENIV